MISSSERVRRKLLPEDNSSAIHNLSYELSELVDNYLSSNYPSGYKSFQKASDNPPITAYILAKLDIEHIQCNPKILHDMNFRDDLQIRPNIEGKQKQRERQAANEYWIAIKIELNLYSFLLYDREALKYRQDSLWTEIFRHQQRRIPRMLEETKEIVIGILSSRDKNTIEEVIDVPLIMQQIQRGIFNIATFATWLGDMLKSYCAPIRDQSIDRMVIKLSHSIVGEETIVVEGLKEMFSILQTMKMDIVNSQILYFRPLLLHDSIKLEFLHNLWTVSRGNVDIEEAKAWYRCNRHDCTTMPSISPGLTQFVYCLINTLLAVQSTSDPSISEFPEILSMDLGRLRSLRGDLSTAINEEIFIFRLKSIFNELRVSKHNTDKLVLEFRKNLVALLANSWTNAIEQVVAEMMRLTQTAINLESRVADHLDERRLVRCMKKQLSCDFQVDSELRRSQNKFFREELVQSVMFLIKKHIKATPSELFHALAIKNKTGSLVLTSKAGNTESSSSSHPNKNIDWISRRLSHIAIIQWRVWWSLIISFDEFV